MTKDCFIGHTRLCHAPALSWPTWHLFSPLFFAPSITSVGREAQSSHISRGHTISLWPHAKPPSFLHVHDCQSQDTFALSYDGGTLPGCYRGKTYEWTHCCKLCTARPLKLDPDSCNNKIQASLLGYVCAGLPRASRGCWFYTPRRGFSGDYVHKSCCSSSSRSAGVCFPRCWWEIGTQTWSGGSRVLFFPSDKALCT